VSGGSKGGPDEALLSRLATCIDHGLATLTPLRASLTGDVEVLRAIDACLEDSADTTDARRAQFDRLQRQCAADPAATLRRFADTMTRWAPGLFAGGDDLTLPADNLALERFFKLPKRHRRHLHGHAHAGIALVHQGPTLVPTLDAHRATTGPFIPDDLRPYYGATPPESQRTALRRRGIMQKARSPRRRPALLATLEARYLVPD
jgi:hypothetical protein